MGVVAIKSAAITNRIAGTLSNANISKGDVQSFVGACTITSGDDIASTYNFGSIPSNAVVNSIKLTSPDLGATTIANFGLSKVDGTVVDADFFVATQTLKDGALDCKEVGFLNVLANANGEKMVWQALNLSADPCISYDVVATLTAAADATGVVVVKGQYTA